MSAEDAGLMSTLFDVGGIIGGIVAGIISDKLGGRACTCGGMLLTGAIMVTYLLFLKPILADFF